jgi:two-component system, NtrC family, response regulator PilR
MPSRLKRERFNNKERRGTSRPGSGRSREIGLEDGGIPQDINYPDALVGDSEQIRMARFRMSRTARDGLNAFITGELGTGIDSVARAIHALCPRSKGPFIDIYPNFDTHWLTEDDFRLYKMVRGGHPYATVPNKCFFEQARGGTIYFIDVEKLPRRAQHILLRVFDAHMWPSTAKDFDFQVIASTSADLDREVQGGRFLMALYHSLGAVNIKLPPLRERRTDIPLLIERLIDVTIERYGYLNRPRITAKAIHLLSWYRWPLNVLELQIAIESLMEMARESGCITQAHVCAELARMDSLHKRGTP